MLYDPSPQIFFEKNYGELTRLVVYLLRMPLDADDVRELLSSFYIMCHNVRTLQRFDPAKASVDTYITLALRNHIYAKLFDRKPRTYTKLSDDLLAKESDAGDTIDLQRFLRTLRGTDLIIAKRLMLGDPPGRIAESMHITPSALSFYRQKLRRLWAAYTGSTTTRT